MRVKLGMVNQDDTTEMEIPLAPVFEMRTRCSRRSFDAQLALFRSRRCHGRIITATSD
jgi:hypothetical protein